MKKFLLIACWASVSCWACTDFVFKCENGTVVAARSMEFAQHLSTAVTAVPAGQDVQSSGPKTHIATLHFH